MSETATPSFDFGAVEPEAVESVVNEYRRLDKQPAFRAWAKQSADTGKGIRITIPADQLATAKSLARLAAKELGKGVRFSESPAANGSVALAFKIKAKREDKGPRKPIKRDAESNAQFQSRVHAWEQETGRKYSDTGKAAPAKATPAKAVPTPPRGRRNR